MRYLLSLMAILLPFFVLAQTPVPHPTAGKGLSPVPAEALAKEGETFAVVVGISDYQDPAIPDLRFADKDAEAFANFLRSPAGGSLDEDHLKLLTNEKATAAQVSIELDWLIETAQEGDEILIYFSGHGDVEAKRLSQPGYLLGWDAPSRVYMAGGAINIRDLQDIVSTLSVENKAKVILITDACRSGKLSGSDINGSQLTSQNLARQFQNELKILSCQPNEYSIEGEQWGGGRGAFSFHLVDGLFGLADSDNDGHINLKEIDRYLEDQVSREVAPHSQNPMTVGDKMVPLSKVFPEILARLKEGRKGQFQLFSRTDQRGMEEEVLAAADTTIVEMYLAFQKAIKEKHFLPAPSGEPANNCADFYYKKLYQEPQLERLHSSMRRNYAAALQDDAQQVMNTMLKSGLTEKELRGAKTVDIYKGYIAYLQRAAELLGEKHYMYPILQARRFFFEGQIAPKRKEKQAFYRKALNLQPEMAHAAVEIIRWSSSEQLDSVHYYFQKAKELAPSWVEPYIAMSQFYRWEIKDLEKAETMLNLAGQLDSTSLYVFYKKAQFYQSYRKNDEAEKWYLKTIKKTGEDICFPCAHLNLGIVYFDTGRYQEAEIKFKDALRLDSLSKKENPSFCQPCSYTNLGNIFTNTKRYEEAEKYYKISLLLDSTIAKTYMNLANLFKETHRYEEAEKYFKKAIQLDSTQANSYHSLGYFYKQTFQYEEAEVQLKKALVLDPSNKSAFWNLGLLYQSLQRWEESEKMIQKAITLGTPNGNLIAALGNAFTHLPGRLEDAKKELDKALEMSPESPLAPIYLAQWSLKKNQVDQAWLYLEKGLEKGLEKVDLQLKDLEDGPDFEAMRKEAKWGDLMEKYFPEN